MERKVAFKVSGGKMLKVTVVSFNGRIASVRINGDFFAYPEDGVERLEAALSGKSFNEVQSAIFEFAKSGVVLYGISPDDITHAIHEASK